MKRPDETQQQYATRLQRENVETMLIAARLLDTNRALSIDTFKNTLGAPNDLYADAAVNMCCRLLVTMAERLAAGEVQTGNVH